MPAAISPVGGEDRERIGAGAGSTVGVAAGRAEAVEGYPAGLPGGEECVGRV